MEKISNIVEMPGRQDANQGQSETSGSQDKTSRSSSGKTSLTTRGQAELDLAKRTQAVRSLILEARAACQQDEIDVKGAYFATILSAWEKALLKVPTEWLERCYLHAIRHHDSSFPLGAGEVASAWEENGKAWVEEEQARKPLGAVCDHCGMEAGKGMEIVERDGRTLGARPCPVCNVERYARWNS